jgi:hypothetical protein
MMGQPVQFPTFVRPPDPGDLLEMILQQLITKARPGFPGRLLHPIGFPLDPDEARAIARVKKTSFPSPRLIASEKILWRRSVAS